MIKHCWVNDSNMPIDGKCDPKGCNFYKNYFFNIKIRILICDKCKRSKFFENEIKLPEGWIETEISGTQFGRLGLWMGHNCRTCSLLR